MTAEQAVTETMKKLFEAVNDLQTLIQQQQIQITVLFEMLRQKEGEN